MQISIMTRLRDETAERHKHAEGRQMEQALVRGVLPRELYVEYLSQRLLIHRALETHVLRLCESDRRLDGLISPQLLQESNLRADLEFFQVDPASIVPREATRRFIAEIQRLSGQTPVALLGAYYVFEGSKNGARFIARALWKAFGLRPGPGTQYLDPHGEQQRPLWQQFKEAMDRIPFAQNEMDAMVEAAKGTFDAVAELDDEIYPSPIATG